MALRAALRLNLATFYSPAAATGAEHANALLSSSASAMNVMELLLGSIWIVGGILLCRSGNVHLGLCLLLQLSAFIYGSLLVLLIRYCVVEDSTDIAQPQDAIVLAIMAISVLLPLERFFTQVSSKAPTKVLQEE